MFSKNFLYDTNRGINFHSNGVKHFNPSFILAEKFDREKQQKSPFFNLFWAPTL